MKINKKELLRELNLSDEYNMADLEILKAKISMLEEMLLGSDEVEVTTISEGDTVRIVDCGQIYPNFDEFVRRICEENYSEDTGEQIYKIWERDIWGDCLAYKNKIGTVLNLGIYSYKIDTLALIAFKNSQGEDVIKLMSVNGLELVN